MPRLLAMRCSSFNSNESAGARFGDRMILFARAATHADGPDDLAGALERHATGKDHHAPLVGGVDAEELASGLRELREVLRRDIERARCKGFLDRDIDAPNPGLIHAHVRDEIAAGISDGDVHRLLELLRFALGGCDDVSCFFQGNHLRLLQCSTVLAPLLLAIARGAGAQRMPTLALPGVGPDSDWRNPS